MKYSDISALLLFIIVTTISLQLIQTSLNIRLSTDKPISAKGLLFSMTKKAVERFSLHSIIQIPTLVTTLLFTLTQPLYGQIPLNSRLYIDKNGETFRYEANMNSYELKGDNNSSKRLIDVLGTDGECDQCVKPKETIPNGFGDVALSSFSGGIEARVNLLRYNLNYSTHGYLPIYILVNANTDTKFNQEILSNSLLGTDTGLLNFKIADDTYTFNQNDGQGICDFKGAEKLNLHGGCYVNLQTGVKFINYRNNEIENKRMAAFYTSAQFAFEFPISESISLERAGRVVGSVGLSGYYANTSKVSLLFPDIEEQNGKTDKVYASFDAGINLVIDKQFSISASYSQPLNNKGLLETVTSFTFTWATN